MRSDPMNFVISFVVLAAMAIAVFVLAMRRFQRLPLAAPPRAAPEQEKVPVSIAPAPLTSPALSSDDAPRCCCGKLATEPGPVLERGRGSVIRDLLSMPPRYRRVVPKEAPLLYCSSHAHVADAKLAEHIATSIRAAFSTAYASVAVSAAAFEQEELHRLVADSLTIEQKRAAKMRAGAGPGATPLRMVPRTGTDDGPVRIGDTNTTEQQKEEPR